MNKTKLIERIQQSDKAAFNELFSEYYLRLCRFAFVILKCQASAEEVVQDVFLKLWEKKEKINVDINLDSYLFIAVKNTSLNLIKFNQVRHNYEFDAVANKKDNDQTFDASAFIRQLQKALAKLPDQCRMIYHLKNFEGLTHSEIAEYLDISEKTVENQVHIALVKLRESLKDHKNEFYSESHE